MRTRLWSTMVMGLACGAAGLAVGFWIRASAIAEDYGAFPLYAALGATLAGAGLWWLLLARRGRYRPLRGVLAGSLAGVVGHYLCWFLLIVAHNVCYWGWGGCTSSLGEPPVDPVTGLWAAALLSLGSLFFYGWLTVPVGALLGGLWAAWQRQRTG